MTEPTPIVNSTHTTCVYTINKLASLAGISTRTLRWYDKCGLLKPQWIGENGYRMYGQEEVNRLQQILFYRALGVSLSEIGRILSAKDFDRLAALQSHHTALCAKKEQLSLLITNVEKSIEAMKGTIIMTDNEKFEGFKQSLVNQNEAAFGEEIRAKYGHDAVARANAKIMGMTRDEYDEIETLTQELNETLKAACEQGDPSSELARKACDLHKRWLCYYWASYTTEAHLGVVQMYVDDPRFTAYYDNITPGCAVFLRDAVTIWLRS